MRQRARTTTIYLSQILVVFLSMILTSDAAHSRPARRAVRVLSRNEYDRSITTFDPNGRLLQVEYGALAAARGESSLVAALIDNCLVIGIASPLSDTEGSTTTSTCHNHHYAHRIDEHVFMFVAGGLHGDALYAAGRLRAHCQEHRVQHGEAPTLAELARFAALELHHPRRGGGRPLGCTLVLAGVDQQQQQQQYGGGEDDEDDYDNTLFSSPLQLFRCGPGGVLEDCRYCATGKHQETLMQQLQREIYDNHDDHSNKNNNNNKQDDGTPTTRHQARMQQVAGILARTSVLSRARRFWPNNNKNAPQKTFTVWTLEQAPERRGQIKAACHYGVAPK